MPVTGSKTRSSNIFMLSLLQSAEQVLGKNELAHILALVQLERYADKHPPVDLEQLIDFAEIAALRFALNARYGMRGGQAMAIRIGRRMFLNLLRYIYTGGFDGLLIVPPDKVPGMIMPGIVQPFSKFAGPVCKTVDMNGQLDLIVEKCPFCWQKEAAGPMCHIIQGILDDGLTRFTQKSLPGDRVEKYHFRIQIATCIANGNNEGHLIVYKMPIDILD